MSQFCLFTFETRGTFHVEPGEREASAVRSQEKETFLAACRQQNVSLTGQQIRLLDRYVAELLQWNKKINLISRKDEENIWANHILHCISLLFAVRIPQRSRIVDIGTGGGLPGVPLKIVRPDLHFLLLDATRKKTEAVSEMVKLLGLIEMEVLWGRAEAIGLQPAYHRKFDFAVSRSVASLTEVIDWAWPFMERSNRPHEYAQKSLLQLAPPALLAFKGGDLSDEVRKAERGHKSVTIRVVDLHKDENIVQHRSEKKLVVVNW